MNHDSAAVRKWPFRRYGRQMDARTIGLAALLISAASPAPAQGQAVRIATITGELIGAASICGVPMDRLQRLGREFIRAARDAADSPAELESARIAHEGAVARSSEVAARNREKICGPAVKAFVRVEKVCVAGGAQACAAELRE